ncbi:Ig-like domain-containing protein [Bittarella massiliensis (ex Durand et al. 2017)]|uniref:Ig-like domain-containing protein n=1 Tax=Bittarella massiliensis (ex Durand et al. 2017) TaxID=1720313 RepID=UPI001AA0DA23|nr:Ig-like domain-containing protein [Bittarella massiliensis (ex Durand et al. 2017)]MBO1678489.1 hypothetical protein [Bittarella massiliensis (ex Durand et al. 2017)]
MKKVCSVLVSLALLTGLAAPTALAAESGPGTPAIGTISANATRAKGEGTPFYANGTPIILSARADGQPGVHVSWEGDENGVDLPEAATVYGGRESGDVASSSITVTGGSVDYVVGGSAGAGTTQSAAIRVEDGQVGMVLATTMYGAKTFDERGTIRVERSDITVNGGTIQAVVGGAYSYTSVGDVKVTVNGGTLTAETSPTQSGVILGGTNGEVTGDATLVVTGGKIKNVAAAQRTIVRGKVTYDLRGGSVGDIHVGSYYPDSESSKVWPSWGSTLNCGWVNYGQAGSFDVQIGENLSFGNLYSGFQFVEGPTLLQWKADGKTSGFLPPFIEGLEKVPVSISLKSTAEKAAVATEVTRELLQAILPSEILTIEAGATYTANHDTLLEGTLQVRAGGKLLQGEGVAITLAEGSTLRLEAGAGAVHAKLAGDESAQALGDNCEYTVKGGKLEKKVLSATGVTLSQGKASLEVGQSLLLKAVVAPSEFSQEVVWASSDEGVATVKDGKVTAVKAGKTTVSATAGAQSASCEITVTEPAVPGGTVETQVNAPEGVELDAGAKEVFEQSVPAELAGITAAGGKVEVSVQVAPKAEEKLDPAEVKLLKENLYEDVQIGQYLDISVLAVGKNAAGQTIGSCAVTETAGKLQFTLPVPEALQRTGRQFAVVRLHGGKVEELPTTLAADGKTLQFETDRFSTYALVYRDAQSGGEEDPGSGEKPVVDGGDTPNTGDVGGMGAALAAAGALALGVLSLKKTRRS